MKYRWIVLGIYNYISGLGPNIADCLMDWVKKFQTWAKVMISDNC